MAAQFLFCDYLFQIVGIGSLQCTLHPPLTNSPELVLVDREDLPSQTGGQKWFKLVCKHKIIKENNGKCAAAHWSDPNIK